MSDEVEKITNDELVEIFNRVLNSHTYIIPVFGVLQTCSHRGDTNNDTLYPLDYDPLDYDPLDYKTYINKYSNKCNKRDKMNKDYYDKKQSDIEYKIEVFENIPKTKIYKVIEEFIGIIERYNDSKMWKNKEAKKLQNHSYKLIQKDIKIIEAYQEIIFNYSSAYEYNDDEEYSILRPELDDIYQQNELFLEELRTKEFNILDPYRYGGTNLYDSTKKRIKDFFEMLKKQYPLKSNNIKQMIDIL